MLSLPSRPRFSILGSVLALLAGANGCGGAPTPPATAADPGASLAPSSPPASSAPAEPAPSRDLLAGIKAFDAKDYPRARASFEAATKTSPPNYEAFVNLGLACEKLGDKDAAEAAYKGALAIKPELESAAAELSALYLDEGRANDAVAIAKAGVSAHPTSGLLHENLGTALAAQGDKDGARGELSRATQIAPTEPMFQLTYAHWLNLWREPGAAPYLETTLRLANGDYAMLASVGYEYRMAGQFDACVRTFDQAIARKDGGEVRTERALCQRGLRDEPSALADLKAAVAVEPSYAPAHFYLAGRLAAGGEFKKAAAEYAKYLDLEPNGSLAKPAAERLKLARAAERAHPKK